MELLLDKLWVCVFGLLCVGLLASLLGALWYYFDLYRGKFLGIPIVPPNSIFGFTKCLMSDKSADNHLVMLAIADKFGPIAQAKLLGDTVILISCKRMAKDVLKSTALKPALLVS